MVVKSDCDKTFMEEGAINCFRKIKYILIEQLLETKRTRGQLGKGGKNVIEFLLNPKTNDPNGGCKNKTRPSGDLRSLSKLEEYYKSTSVNDCK